MTHTGTNLKMLGDFGSLTYNRRTYTASQVIFYRRSEHTFGVTEATLDLEMQIMHESEDHHILVLVVLYRVNTTNSLFMEQLDFSQAKGIQSGDFRNIQTVVDLGLTLNSVSQMVSYDGSLTRPPCTPNNQYIIITNIKKITQEFLDVFPEDLRGLHRPPQEREDRPLTLINYIGGINSSQKPIPARSQSPRTNFDPTYDTDEIQGFRLNPDVDIEISNRSPYPIVAEINTHLPFPDFQPLINQTKSENKSKEEKSSESSKESETETEGTTSESSPSTESSVDNNEEGDSESSPNPDSSSEGDVRIQQSPIHNMNEKYKEKIEYLERLEAAQQKDEKTSEWISDNAKSSVLDNGVSI